MMHENSIKAFNELDTETRVARILGVYVAAAKPLTDREVANRLGFDHPAEVRPRITDLVKADPPKLTECDGTKCVVTGKTVRTCRIATEWDAQMSLFDGGNHGQ